MNPADASHPIPPRNRPSSGQPLHPRRWQPPPPETLADAFPGLHILSLAGIGGMGAVYRAQQKRLGRTVAVKVLPAAADTDPEAPARFEREARILSRLNHPNILKIHDFGSLPDGTLYLVTEWAEGGDLAKKLNSHPQPLPVVHDWVRQIASALQAAHARGIIHRDLKPSNILVLDDGRLLLADFGLAQVAAATEPNRAPASPATTSPDIIQGTFDYLAPEIIQGTAKADARSDLYALGVMTYQMLTGRVPRGTYARASRLCKIPPEVDAFLHTALAPDPAQRPADAAEFARGFERATLAPARRRHRRILILGALLIGLATAWARYEIHRAEQEAAEASARAERVAHELNEWRTRALQKPPPQPTHDPASTEN